MLITLVSLPAWAESKVGVINIERVMRDSEPAKRAMKKLERNSRSEGRIWRRCGSRLKRCRRIWKNGVAMGDTPRKSKEKELAALSLEFQRKQREMNEDLNVRRNEELQGVGGQDQQGN